MYISELKLQGFKSFAYKTDVTFDRGITAIVGPNGCGKSNIVDALRWVLGEQRPTLLRSASMSNVIFNGTANKNALGMAEVSLTFINNKGLLPTEYSEVTITRRLYRSGDSDYLINGTTCRLKDIMELFMDTGMSSDAYSVIELKMVEEILTNKNNERRNLFEEAAGITGYKKKRKASLRKLESTKKDLQRVKDIVSEVSKKARSLERQSKKAKKANEYRAELERLDKAFNHYKYENIQQELEPLKERIENADKEKKELLNKANELEQQETSIRDALNEKERRQSEAQRRVDQMASNLRDKETSLQITGEKINNERDIIKQYENDIKEGEQDLKELQELFEYSKKQFEALDEKGEKAERSLSESKKTYNKIQQKYAALSDKLNNLQKDFTQKNEALNQLKNKQIKMEARLENTDEDIARIKEDKKQLEHEIGGLQVKKKELTTELNGAEKAHTKAEQTLEKTRKKRAALSQKQNELKDELRSLQSNHEKILAEIDLLQTIASSNEAFPGSVKYLVKNHSSDFKILKVVSDLLSSDEEHAVALEAALGDVLNFVVVESLAEAHKAVQILKEKNKGQATFIPLGQLADSYDVLSGALAQHVQSPRKYKALKELLLGKTFFVESLEEMNKKLTNGQSVVSRDGEVVTGNSFLKSGSSDKNAGMRVGLHDKIEKLEKKAGKAASKIEKCESDLSKTTETLDKIAIEDHQASVKECQSLVHTLEGAFNNIESKIQIYQQNIEGYEKRAVEISELRDTGREKLKALQPEQKELEKLIDTLIGKRETKKGELKKLEEERSIAQDRFNEARLKHQDLKNKISSVERDVERTESGIINLKLRLENRAESKQESKKQIQKYEKAIETLKEKIELDKAEKQGADKKLEEAKESSAEQRGTINSIEKELKEVRRQKEVNMELMHHLSMAKEKFEMQARNIADHIWETYEMLMDQIKNDLPEDTSADEAKERVSWLRQRLNRIGEVNELAIEEYEEEKERLDFYEEQIADLESAQNELWETITEINKTAEERFNTTFEQIRTNFQNVFHTLFEEDDFCDLTKEENAEDPLEAAIHIEANPRGKRPTSINQLSGGEKTLTAIALLFAIYLVKPSPFCVLDEVDAPLDDANIDRFADMIQRFSKETQFIIITHNKMTMAKAEMMYGVTMPETGISRLVGVRIDELAEAS